MLIFIMAKTGHSNKNSKNMDEEIEKLKEILLKKEEKFSEELERIGKSSIGRKVFISFLLIFCSIGVYYMKTRDQSITELNEKLNKELKLKDQKINDMNKQLELKDSHLKAMLSEAEHKEQAIVELNKKISLKDKRVEELITELEERNNKFIELENNFMKIQTQFKEFESNCLMKDKQIESLSNEIESKEEKIDEKFIHRILILDARNSTAQVLYAYNETIAQTIISLIQSSLMSQDLYICEETKPEFDVYRNCFRDLSIALHNQLYKEMGPYWVVTSGSIDHCFTINIINEMESEQYFLRVGRIYFEIFRYKEIFFDNQNNEVFVSDENTEQNTVLEENKENQ